MICAELVECADQGRGIRAQRLEGATCLGEAFGGGPLGPAEQINGLVDVAPVREHGAGGLYLDAQRPKRVGQDVVNLPGDPVPLVQGGGAALLKAHLLGLGQQCRGLLCLDAVAEDEPAEEKPEDHEQRYPEEVPGINRVGELCTVDGDDPGGGDDARRRQAQVVGRDTGDHRGEHDERWAALRERRPATGHGGRCRKSGKCEFRQLERFGDTGYRSHAQIGAPTMSIVINKARSLGCCTLLLYLP